MEMLENVLGLVIAVAIVVFFVFVICLSILVYLSEDRKILENKISKLEVENKEYFEKYANYKINNSILCLKLDLLKSLNECCNDDE